MLWLCIELLIYVCRSWVFLSSWKCKLCGLTTMTPCLDSQHQVSSWKTDCEDPLDSGADANGIFQIFHNILYCSLLWSKNKLWNSVRRALPSSSSIWCFSICIKQYLNYTYQMRHMNAALIKYLFCYKLTIYNQVTLIQCSRGVM